MANGKWQRAESRELRVEGWGQMAGKIETKKKQRAK
jgi:hypothetical protein